MDIDEVLAVVSALDSKTRLRYVLLLDEQPLSTRELREKYNQRYEETMRRESVHRGIENLRKADILTRSYDEDQNHFKYELAASTVTVTLDMLDVELS